MCILISTPNIHYGYLFAKCCCTVRYVYATIINTFFGKPFVRSNIYSVLPKSNHQIESTQLNHDS